MPVKPELRRLAAFTLDAAGGNPAGVWIGRELPDPVEMQRIAAEVGDSETAFLAPDGTGRPGAYRVRYFSHEHGEKIFGRTRGAIGSNRAACNVPDVG